MLSNYFSIAGLIVMDYIIFRFVFKNIWIDYKVISKKMKVGKWTKGTIIGFESKIDLDQHTQFAPIVSFVDQDSKIEYKISSNDYRLTKPPLNSIVSVCYNPNQPTDAVVNPQSILSFKVFLMVLVLIIVLSINVGILYKLGIVFSI